MGGTDTLVPFDIETGEPILPSVELSPEASGAYDVTIHPLLPEVWVAGRDQDGLVILDRNTTAEIARLDLATDDSFLVDIAFSPEGDIAYVSDRDADRVVLIDVYTHLPTGEVVETPTGFAPGWMAVHPRTGDVYLTDWQSEDLIVIDAEALTTTRTPLGDGFRLRDLVFAPDLETLYVANGVGNDVILFINVETLTIEEQVGVGEDPWAVDVTPDGAQLFVANQDSRDVSVIETSTLVVETIDLTDSADPRDVDIAEDGSAVFVPTGGISGDDGVFVIDPDTHALVDTHTFGSDDTRSSVLAVAPQALWDLIFRDGFESISQAGSG
jgi:YVTN family beta-propeller protein